MKKITSVLTASLFALFSATAMACPQGTTLTGGTGANHKGGKCVSFANVKAQTKQKLNKENAHLNKVDAQNVQAMKQDSKMALKTAKEKAKTTHVNAQKSVTNAHQNHNSVHS